MALTEDLTYKLGDTGVVLNTMFTSNAWLNAYAPTVNYNFEQGSTDGWFSTNATIALESTTVHAGSFAGKITVTGSDPRAEQTDAASTTLLGNELKLRVSGWIQSPSIDVSNAQVGVNFKSTNGTFISSATTTVDLIAGIWTFVTGEFNIPTGAVTGTVGALFGIQGSPGVGVELIGDDILIEKLVPVESTPFVDITKASGFDNAPFRETERDHEGVDGGFLDAEFEQGRPIILEGSAIGTVEELMPLLETLKADFAPSRTLLPFYFRVPGLGERVMFVKPRGCRYDWDQALRHGEVPIQFQAYAEDPRQYDSQLQTVTIAWSQATDVGFAFNLGFDFGFGASVGFTDGAYVTNLGNRSTPAIMTITGPVVDPRIVNDTMGKTLLFSPLALGPTDTLVIDLGARTVRLNGAVNRRGSLQSPDWFLFEKGDTFIRYQGSAGTGSFLTVQLRSAWR